MGESTTSGSLLDSTLKVVNVGLEVFYQSLRGQGVNVVHVEWQPPAGGDPRLAGILDRLSGRRSDQP